MASRLTRATIAIGLSWVMLTASAEDIDLFVGESSPDLPNVLLVLDNSANWSSSISVGDCYYRDDGVITTDGPEASNPGKEQGTKMAIEKCALYNLIDSLPTNDDGSAQFNVGLMLFNESPASNSGGYPRKAFTPLTAANKAAFKTVIKNLGINSDKGNNAAFAKTMHEAYLYFKGHTPYKGTAGTKWDSAAVSGGQYVSPSTNTCGRNYIIFIANGSPGEVTDNEAKALLLAAGGNVTQINHPTSYVKNSDQGNWADEYARFLTGVDVSTESDTQNIVTHTIAVTGASSDGLFPNFIRSMADHGGGSFYEASSADVLLEAAQDVFNKIQAVNSVFASASLPVSVNTQGVYLNQVFIGMFRPNGDFEPRWDGNLKQYQFKLFGDGSLKLADKDGTVAINTGTGFITSCAKSYWTPDSTDTYWSFKSAEYENFCPTVDGAAASNSPDGDVVEKGAAGYRLRSIAPADRVVKTCSLGSCSSLTDFETSNDAITDSALGVSITEKDDLIDWIRGKDIDDENGNDVTDEMRPSVHGDVVHSRPLAVDYGGLTGVVVYYGSNDGALHAINGNKSDTAGNELWSFIAPEHYANFKRLRANSPLVYYPVVNDEADAERKNYFMDGSITGYKSGSTIWLYPTMRRGGRVLYAFDVSTPSNPTVKWRIGCPNLNNDIGCSAGMSGIGQTWSAPKAVTTAGYTDDDGNAKPLLIVGGGYDGCEDDEPNSCSSPKGNKIYVLDADDGTVLTTLGTTRSVPADVIVLDTDNNNRADLAYAVDTGGNVYRIAIGNAAPTSWTITRIAALGCDGGPCSVNSGARNRKFLFAPEVVVTSGFNAILVGSGDREHPLLINDARVVDNAFFMIRDNPSNSAWLSSESSNCGGTSVICTTSLLEIDPESTTTPTTSELNAKKGWYLAFGDGGSVHDREQVVTSAVVVAGVVYFSTHTPTAATACSSNLGTARGYSVNFFNASSSVGTQRYSNFAGGGLPPSPVAGVVEVANPDGNGTSRQTFVLGGRQQTDDEADDSALEGQNPALTVTGARKRAYWMIERK